MKLPSTLRNDLVMQVGLHILKRMVVSWIIGAAMGASTVWLVMR